MAQPAAPSVQHNGTAAAAAMMALRAHAPGGPEVLVYEPASRPVPAVDEVVVEVYAAAITFAELTWEETWRRAGVDRTPTIPAHEFSGVVVEVGEQVSDIDTGAEVYGLVRFDRNGAAADALAVPAADLARKPRSIPHTMAAALPLAALTAWQALRDHARLQPGERVLVHGGAGGVGAFGVQLARELGAHVTATARGVDADLVRRLGAHRVVDFEHERFEDASPVFDVVLDTVGGQTLDRSFAVLRPGGRLVTLQAPPSQEKAQQAGVTATFFIVTPDRDALDEIARLVDAGRLEVLLAATYPVADGRAAFESGQATERRPGKTVLVVRP